MTPQLASELAALLGRHALLVTGQEKLRVEVVILEAKTSYGRPRVLVAPVAGDTAFGVWIDADRLLEIPRGTPIPVPTAPAIPPPPPPRPEKKKGTRP